MIDYFEYQIISFILLIIALIVLGTLFIEPKNEDYYIQNSETQINQLKFEQEYIEYVKEDNERQIQ